MNKAHLNCVKSEIILGSSCIYKKKIIIIVSNTSMHVTGVSMNTSENLLSSAALKESGKLIINSVSLSLANASTCPVSLIFLSVSASYLDSSFS